MRSFVRLGLLACTATLPVAAQTSCSTSHLSAAATNVTAIRHKLHAQSTPADDGTVPAPVAAQLGELKDALADAAAAAFACAPASASAEQLQSGLAKALHANEATGPEALPQTKDGKDLGAYGSELAVQVFELFGTPRLFEVDFRYGIECGDDNLLLVYEAASDAAPDGWHRQLRWDAATYNSVGDALGDFVLLTPLSGDPQHPTWRYLVAHGHPGCGATPRPSHFDLDLLTPTINAGKPQLAWHFEHPYTQGAVIPRLATTEDTIEFRLTPGPPSEVSEKAAAPVEHPEVYRFHMTTDGRIEPSPSSSTNEGSATVSAAPEGSATRH
jgi:hypothetical protein